jgi:murein DD-endopeptidase MepM/ murein hydrolase activator NlpD
VRRFGWMRLACLFLVLTVLTALVRLGDTGAEARSLAARVPDAMSLASGRPENPTVTRWTEDQISSLEDISDDALRAEGASQAAEPQPPVPDEPGQVQPAKEEARVVFPSEPPVFYRPAGPGTSADSGPVCGDLRGAPEGGKIVFPLERRFFYSYEDTWGAPRTQGGHEGTDLMTSSGVPEYAITDGTVVPVAGSDAEGWNTLGGHAVMIRADYSIGPVRAGDLFYYAHLERESPLRIGTRVNAGQVVGYAGDTGQGPPGTSGLFPPHLHLGWYDGTGDRQATDSGAMNPYPLLEWIRANGGAVTGDSDARFCEAPRTGPPIPSAHDGAWPTPASPGLSPDLDTGSRDPKPVRAAQRNDRDQNTPTKKPSRPDRPKQTRNEAPSKPPERDRPQAPKHDRPDTGHQRPARPDSSEDQHVPPKPDLPEKDPPKPNPSESQYDSSTGGPPGPTEKPLSSDADRDPEADRRPDANEPTR